MVLLQAPPTSAPPLVSVDAPLAPPVMSRLAPVEVPLKPLANAVHFSPASLFALFVSVEYERLVAGPLTVFGTAGGGPFGQFAFDLGVRLYPVERPFESFFADLRGSAFVMTNGMAMMGPAVTVGYAWRTKNDFLVSLGFGASMWWSLSRLEPPGTIFLATRPIDAFVISLPGFFQPSPGQNAMQPTIRLTFGPGF